LGVSEDDLKFLNYPDGKLDEVKSSELEDVVRQEIDLKNWNVVIYPDPRDKHADHAQTGRAVKEVIDEEGDKPISYQYLVHNNRFPQPKKFAPNQFLLPPISSIRFDQEWQRFMLSTKEEDQKTEAIYSYQSQLRVPFLRSLILSSVRKNELFSIPGKND
jgi:LmbE family N-acetylglucosaminyl deacetylase